VQRGPPAVGGPACLPSQGERDVARFRATGPPTGHAWPLAAQHGAEALPPARRVPRGRYGWISATTWTRMYHCPWIDRSDVAAGREKGAHDHQMPPWTCDARRVAPRGTAFRDTRCVPGLSIYELVAVYAREEAEPWCIGAFVSSM
jgi:hypothetical protein